MKKIQKQHFVACFKRWSRKGYSVFASLGKQVKIGVLCIGMTLISLSTNEAYAAIEVDSLAIAKSVDIDDVGITLNRETPTRSAMTQTPIFDRATQHVAPLQTLESALRLSPAVDVRERGAKGVQADFSIRGGSFDQTMVLLNGINFTCARTGHQTHVLPIDIGNVAGIEIIDGISGVGAYAGAINVRTAPLKSNYMRLEASGGAYGYGYGNLSGGFTRGDLNIFATGSYRRSDGYIYNTAFETFNGYVRAMYDSEKWGLLDAQIGAQDRNVGANGFYSLAYKDQMEAIKVALGSLRWVKSLSNSLELNSTVSYNKSFDRFELIHNKPDVVPYNYHNDDNFGAELWLDYKWLAGETTIGGDYALNHIWSSKLGEDVAVPNGVYTKAKRRDIFNGYLRHHKSWERVDLALSLGASSTPYGVLPLWSISSRYRPVDGLLLELGANESMRLPTFNDLYYNSPTNVADVNLKPESAMNYRFNVGYDKSQLHTALLLYYRDGNNIIDWTKAPGEEKWHSRQITSLQTFGVEYNVSYTFDAMLKRLTASYGYINQNKQSAEYISQYALNYMTHKGVLSAEFSLFSDFSLVLTGSMYDRYGSYLDIKGNKVDYEPYALVDGRLAWERGAVKIYLDATNITSTQYYDYGGVEMPRAWLVSGVVLTL